MRPLLLCLPAQTKVERGQRVKVCRREHVHISREKVWSKNPKFLTRVSAFIGMPIDDYKTLASMSRAQIADMDADGYARYEQMQVAAMSVHNKKLELLEELIFDNLVEWIISRGLGTYLASKLAAAPAGGAPAAAAPVAAEVLASAAPAELREAVVQCFRPGAIPIEEILHASRKGLWAELADGLLLTKSDMETPHTKKGYRVLQQILRWRETIDMDLLAHPQGRGNPGHRRRRLAVVTEDGVRVLYASQPPPAKVKDILEKEFRDKGLFEQGEVILNVVPKMYPTREGGCEMREHDMSGRRIAEHKWLPTVWEEARNEGFLASLPPFVCAGEDGAMLMPAKNVEERAEFLEAKLARVLHTTLSAEREHLESLTAWRQRVRRAEICYRSPRCRVPRTDLPAGECECCSSVPWCTTCDRSKHVARCECLSTPVLRCTACPRTGVRDTASVVTALYAYADLGCISAETISTMRTSRQHRGLLETLCELEHRDRNDELLAELGEPAREGESYASRELRLTDLQNCIDGWEWADGAPICGKSYLARVFGFVFDHKTFNHSHACLQWCSEPRLSLLIPISDSLTNLVWLQGYVVDGWALLSEAITLSDGSVLRFRFRFLKGDAPIHQKHNGVNTGNGKFRCWCCNAAVLSFTDLVACLECTPRTIASLDAVAQRLTCVSGCGLKINPRTLRIAQLRALATRMKMRNTAQLKRPQLEQLCIDQLQGVNSRPAVLGGCSPAELPVLTKAESAPDFPLHVLKGDAQGLRSAIKEHLQTADLALFTEAEKGVDGAKEVYAGADYRKWLYASPHLFRSINSENAVLADLRNATFSLAHAVKFGYRQVRRGDGENCQSAQWGAVCVGGRGAWAS